MNLALTAVLLGHLSLVQAAEPPTPPCDGIDCQTGGGGAEVGYSREEARALADKWPEGASQTSPHAWFEYAAVIDCMPPNTISQPRLEICESAAAICSPLDEANLAYSIIFRRTVSSANGVEQDWEAVGGTCFLNSVPPRSGEPAEELTDAMILEQFHRTQFALPQIVVQPPDGQTLVNLPVYFELAWPEEGFAPEEIDTVTIVGHQVRIKPTLGSVTYHAGDGTSIGPTTSLGGPYPTGDITHEYPTSGAVSPYITVEYGGEVSVDGGGWRTIPGSATIDGPAVDLQVLTSRNRLYDN